MRIRNNNIVIRNATRSAWTGPSLYSHCDGTTRASTASAPALNAVSAAHEERMEDTVGKGRVNSVHHRVFEYDINDVMSSTNYASYDSVAGKWGTISYGQPVSWFENSNVYVKTDHSWNVAHKDSIPPFWTIQMPTNESSLKNEVMEKARQLKADVLLNVVEANQMWPSVRSLATSIPNMASNWRDIRKVIKTASGAFLAWKFGVSPILQDTMNIVRYMPKLQQGIDRHGSGDKQRFSVVAVAPMSFQSGSYYGGPFYQNGVVTSDYRHQGRLNRNAQIRYVLTVKPKTKYHTAFFKAADAVMSRFATSPASLAWEKIPFSFVLDWFVDLRGALNKVDDVLGFHPYEIVGFSRSFSYHCSTDCFVDLFSPCGGGSTQSFRQCSLEYKHYARGPVVGGSLPSVNTRFGKNQAAISAALISQKLSQLSGAKR